MLVLKFHLTEEEYFEYNYYTSWGAPDKRGYRLRYYGKVFALYTVVAALYIISRHEDMLANLVIFSVIAVLYFLMVPFIIRWSIRRRIKDILQQQGNEHILEETEVILSDTGIIDKDKLSETKYDWEAIVRKSETINSIYLYTNTYHAIVIPKRVVSSPPDKTELDRLFNQHLPLSSEFLPAS